MHGQGDYNTFWSPGTGPECENNIDMNFTTYFNQTKQLFGKLFNT